jgi:transcriptional repressor NrdR
MPAHAPAHPTMHCPFCGHPETRVIDSRLAGEGVQVRRRRECERCSERFTTYESAQLAMPAIIKRDNRRQPFDEDKLRRGLRKALEKRPVSDEQVEAAVERISRGLRATGEREIQSRRWVSWSRGALRDLDQVAYVRFASVYRSFEDIEAFRHEVERLHRRNRGREPDAADDSQLLIVGPSDPPERS